MNQVESWGFDVIQWPANSIAEPRSIHSHTFSFFYQVLVMKPSVSIAVEVSNHGT